MKNISIAILTATLYLVFYQLSPFIGMPDDLIIALFFLSPFVVLYLVYSVLKHGQPSKYTFDEKFYDDLDYRREGKEEMDGND
jgi:hypothetical protein